MASLRSVKGMNDLFGVEALSLGAVESLARNLAKRWGAEEVRTPVLEKLDLFVRSVGEATDVVGKEMYAFEDKDGSQLCLRPEATASVARMLVQHGILRDHPRFRAFYAGPMFRRERPQKGRYRQFHQVGVEFFGEPEPSADVEVIALAAAILDALGLDDVVVELGSVGCPECRPSYREQLVAFLRQEADQLCELCNQRTETNPLRCLDCKSASCQAVYGDAPLPLDHLCDACDQHQAGVEKGLDRLGLDYRVNKRLVRGLDYYRRTVFECTTQKLGAQSAVIAGGRYDGLLGSVGGDEGVAAVGFAAGTERLQLLAREAGTEAGLSPADVAIVTDRNQGVDEALVLMQGLRASGLVVVADLSDRGRKAKTKWLGRTTHRHSLFLEADGSARLRLQGMETQAVHPEIAAILQVLSSN
ncbi:MAG: histidine--tRNA ligase [Myxococcales bacterium]|nr:histidine--tRNA ligase [Myxococcales bacterium]